MEMKAILETGYSNTAGSPSECESQDSITLEQG